MSLRDIDARGYGTAFSAATSAPPASISDMSLASNSFGQSPAMRHSSIQKTPVMRVPSSKEASEVAERNAV